MADVMMSATPAVDMTRTLAERAYARLRTQILEGQLLPGERINQSAICAALGISRTPLREVLHRLEAEGLVAIFSHRRVEVARQSIQDINEYYAVRALLESHAARLACERRTRESIERIQDSIREMNAAADAAQSAEPDSLRLLTLHKEFHNLTYANAGNHRLMEIIEVLRDRCDWFRRVHLNVPHQVSNSLKEHQAIAAAYIQGDSSLVAQLIRDNLENTALSLTAFLRDHGPSTQLSSVAESEVRS